MTVEIFPISLTYWETARELLLHFAYVERLRWALVVTWIYGEILYCQRISSSMYKTTEDLLKAKLKVSKEE